MKALRFVSLVLLVAVVFCVGCGNVRKDATRVRVTGKVSLNGKPLQTGTIAFDPGNGEPPAVLDILDGNYEGKAAVGKNIVRISATRKMSMKQKMGFDGPGYDQEVEENMLPERYNQKSEIKREVEATGENRFDFPLNTNN